MAKYQEQQFYRKHCNHHNQSSRLTSVTSQVRELSKALSLSMPGLSTNNAHRQAWRAGLMKFKHDVSGQNMTSRLEVLPAERQDAGNWQILLLGFNLPLRETFWSITAPKSFLSSKQQSTKDQVSPWVSRGRLWFWIQDVPRHLCKRQEIPVSASALIQSPRSSGELGHWPSDARLLLCSLEIWISNFN